MKLIRFYFLSVFLFYLGFTTNAQENNKAAKEGFEAFDAVVGIENTDLSRGLLYSEKFRTINDKKQFFKSSKFEMGNIWHNNQPYYSQRIKYDAHHDELLVQLLSNTTGQQASIQLFKTEVDSFDLQEHHFIRLSPTENGPIPNIGFYESLYQEKDLRLFVKHRKNKIERKGDRFVYYEFADLKKQYLLFYKGTYFNLNSKRDFGEALAINKKDLNRLYNKAKRANKNQDTFMVELIKQIVRVP